MFLLHSGGHKRGVYWIIGYGFKYYKNFIAGKKKTPNHNFLSC